METKSLSDKQKYPAMRSVPDESLLENDSISIEYYDSTRLAIGLIEDKTHYTIINHLGDLGVYSNVKKDEYFEEAITRLKTLLDFCVLELINSSLVDKNHDYKYFKVNLSSFYLDHRRDYF